MIRKPAPTTEPPKYPGTPTAVDGTTAVVEMETAASDAAGAYPITPSTQMGEGWAAAVAAGQLNVNGRPLLFFEPEGEHAAAAVTAGMSMTGLRAANFSSGQGIAYMHESLYAAVGKRLTYVLNVAARAMTKHALNVHAGHDDYHAVDDTGFFQLFAKDAQEAADLTLCAHRIAELALTPGICAQDGFLTSHVIESIRLPERELIKEFLGDPADLIPSPTPAQRHVFGDSRRRIPELFDLDYPTMMGVVQNQDSYQQGVAAQRPFYFDHIPELADATFALFETLTGRGYARASGYRLEDAEYVLAGQGSVVANAEAVADYLRAERGLKVGVLNFTMFRPFPSDLVTRLLAGKRGVTVLERLDQPLAVDGPLLREIRAAMNKAVENGRQKGPQPFSNLPRCRPEEIPDFYSGCFGLGSRDLQPQDLIATVENMLPDGARRRQFYLGIEFIRRDTRLPKLEIWQQELLETYPHLGDLSLPPSKSVNLLPRGATALRIHSVGGWGAITMGKQVALTASDLFGLFVKANPKYGSEKKGQPTTFYATLASEPIRLNCELQHVNVVLAPDPNVFRHSDPLAGLAEGGVFVVQTDRPPAEWWENLPATAQQAIRERKLQVYLLDAFSIAMEEASDPELRYRMQGAAFMGAFFRTAGLLERHRFEAETVFEGIKAQLIKKFGHRGERVVEDNLRVIRRGFDEIQTLDAEALPIKTDEVRAPPVMPANLDGTHVQPGVGNPGRFWEQVCFLYRTGSDGIADPFAAMSVMPAATSTIRDMTDIRFEVPVFVPDRCTGCAQCWTQCPDAAIPGVVNTVEEIIEAAIASESAGRSFDRLRPLVRPIAGETRKILKGVSSVLFADALATAYRQVTGKLNLPPERRRELDGEFAAIYGTIEEFPVAKTGPFFDLPESREKGSGGLLSITVNPEACKGCNLCVEVCPDEALVTVKQDPEVVDRLRRQWRLWQHLPETDDRYVNIASLEEGIGVLSSLLLKQGNYRSMVGGDGACMGCGEKTAVHLVLSAVNALMRPRVTRHVERLERLISELDAKARGLLASEVDLDDVTEVLEPGAGIPLSGDRRKAVERVAGILHDLKDLRWRYTEGPSGKGRATVGMANSTGCSSVWGSTYPYNPYPFPWVNHLFQDSPSIAIGVFEGHMRKMATGFAAIRRAELELAGQYDPATHDPDLARFDWHQFTPEEFDLCPPIIALGGDGAMLDIGFQNLSRLLVSGKPIRVVVLDTQVYSNTGGQACTSGFLGQVSDMAAYGTSQHGKEETRKELSLIAMAHRNVFVLQSSQAAPSHLIGGVLRGLQSRYPAVFMLHSPCPPEHGLGDDESAHAAKLALECRAYPLLVYDPGEGTAMVDRLSLDGNPSPEDRWPTYELRYRTADGATETMELPVTIADWAATETRFKRHFHPASAEAEGLLPFHEYMESSTNERDGLEPFIYIVKDDGTLGRLVASSEIVRLAEDRLEVWSLLRQLAGDEVAGTAQDRVAEALEEEFAAQRSQLQQAYEAQLADLKSRYARTVARRMAEGLVRAGNGGRSVADLIAEVAKSSGAGFPMPRGFDDGDGSQVGLQADSVAGRTTATADAVAPVPEVSEEPQDAEEDLAIEPWIESARCTSCDECTRLNGRMFAYNEKKQAYIKDPRGGTFRELVMAAEKCPVQIIHPGTPLNPKEKDLAKWVARAERFA